MNQSLSPPKPSPWNITLSILVIAGCTFLLGLSSIGLLAPDLFTNITAAVFCLMYLVLAFQQYLGTFRARASSARWAAILSAMVGVLLLAGIFAVRDVAQFLFFLAMMNTFLCASRCNQLWYVSLDRYRAAGGVWPGRLRFRISEIVMLIALTVVVLGIVSY